MAEARFIKEFWARIGLFALNASGVDIGLLSEDDGTLRNQLLGYDGSNQIRIGAEATTGTLKTMLYGQDAASNEDPLRTNANQQLQVEVVNDVVQVDSVILTTGLAAIFNPGSTASEQYEVWVQFTNYTGTAATVDLAVDIGGGTTADRFWLNDYTVPAADITRWFGPIGINGDDDVIALASANTTIVAHLRVVQIA